ncbi:MAG: hypothetical protein ACRCZB_03745 [Bacteroidales bacterium]
MQELHNKLMRDLRIIGIRVKFDLELKPYSKSYYGRYNPNSNKVTLYAYEDPRLTTLIDYEELLTTLVHESIHCMQWQDENFVRVKGVMHNLEFHRLLECYSKRVRALMLLKEVVNGNIIKGLSNRPTNVFS